jgi:hypothetical protein
MSGPKERESKRQLRSRQLALPGVPLPDFRQIVRDEAREITLLVLKDHPGITKEQAVRTMHRAIAGAAPGTIACLAMQSGLTLRQVQAAARAGIERAYVEWPMSWMSKAK